MADHKHGSMDIKEQEKTFAGVMTWTVRIVIFIIVALLLLALING